MDFYIICSLLNFWFKVNNPAHRFSPCWLLSSILWGSIWIASDPAPYRCVHYLSEEEEEKHRFSTASSVCVCRHTGGCIDAFMRNPPLNAPCSKSRASESSHQTASALLFVLGGSAVPSHFFTSLCRALICSWSDAFHELPACWCGSSEFLYNENPLKRKKESRGSLAERQRIFIITFVNCNEDETT